MTGHHRSVSFYKTKWDNSETKNAVGVQLRFFFFKKRICLFTIFVVVIGIESVDVLNYGLAVYGRAYAVEHDI